MNICVFTHTFPKNKTDGSAAFMKEFCDGLVENGHKVTLLTPWDMEFKRKGDKFKIETYKYIWPDNFHVLGYSRALKADINLKLVNALLVPFLVFFGTISLIKIIRRDKIDLVSVNWLLPNGLMALIASKITGTPYVINMPGSDVYLFKKYKFLRWISKIIANGSVGLISASTYLVQSVFDLEINPNLPKAIISFSVDVQKFKPVKTGLAELRKKYKVENKLIVLAIGRLVYKKGFEYLVEAMPVVVKKIPNAHLLIGGAGDLDQELKDLTNKLNMQENITFLGHIPRDQGNTFFNLADIMVTPSVLDKGGNIDGRPLVILESIACGKPQIVTNLPGVSDEFINGTNGFIVKEKNPAELSVAIIKLLESKVLRDKIGKINRNFAMDKLSTKKVGGRYTKFYEEILEINETSKS